jgi:hypothetical protein
LREIERERERERERPVIFTVLDGSCRSGGGLAWWTEKTGEFMIYL